MKWAGAVLFLCMLALMSLGLVILTSTGDVQGARLFSDANHFWRQQLVFGGVALAACLAVTAFPPSFWFRPWIACALLAFVAFALVAVHVPGLGYRANGSTRWIRLPGLLLQPSEFVKLAAILLVAWWAGAPGRRNASWREGFWPPILFLGVCALGFLSQPDLGSTVMLLAVNGALLFVSGMQWRQAALCGAVAALALGTYVAHDPERLSRITAAWGLGAPAGQSAVERDAGGVWKPAIDDDKYQLHMGLSALASGGLRGRGLGNSLFKQRYLPEYHTDFILAMVGEELGLRATLACVALFLAMAAAGFYLAFRAPDRRTTLLAAGMTLQICLSAGVNVGVVTGAFPTKGLALPFLSYGGSSLIASVLAVGFLLGIAFHVEPAPPRPAPAHRPYVPPATNLWNE